MNNRTPSKYQPQNLSHLSPKPKPTPILIQPQPQAQPFRPLSPEFRPLSPSPSPIRGNSHFKYVPYEKKIVSYEERQYVERIPVRRKVMDCMERKVVESVPRETVVTDYYAVENIKQYYKQTVPESTKELVPKQKKTKKLQYIPIQKQIIHYPQNAHTKNPKLQSRLALQSQGIKILPDAQYRELDPTLLYKYSSRNKDKPVGYVQDGCQRNLSTAPSMKNIGMSGGVGGVEEQGRKQGKACGVLQQINSNGFI